MSEEKKTYTIAVYCDNCHYGTIDVQIPYGEPKELVLNELPCKNCGVTGALYSTPSTDPCFTLEQDAETVPFETPPLRKPVFDIWIDGVLHSVVEVEFLKWLKTQ